MAGAGDAGGGVAGAVPGEVGVVVGSGTPPPTGMVMYSTVNGSPPADDVDAVSQL